MANPCPIPGCKDHSLPGQLLCPEHWRHVPHRQQLEVWDSWRELRHGRPSSLPRSVIVRLRVKRYQAARQAAIDHVAGLQKVYA